VRTDLDTEGVPLEERDVDTVRFCEIRRRKEKKKEKKKEGP
jgi:hypothetical protein